MLTRGAHKRCSQEVLTRCSQEVLTRGAHKRCSQGVLTRGAHKRCSQWVLTRGAHKVLTTGAHKRCSQGVLTRGAHKRCSQGRKLATFWRKVAQTLNKHETNLAEAWNNLAQTCAALSQGKASNSRHNPHPGNKVESPDKLSQLPSSHNPAHGLCPVDPFNDPTCTLLRDSCCSREIIKMISYVVNCQTPFELMVGKRCAHYLKCQEQCP